MPKPTRFKSLLLKQLFIAIGVAFAVSLPITSLPAYWFLQHSIKAELSQLNDLSHQAIHQHLATGWQPDNINKVYRQLHQTMPDAGFYLQKAPRYLSSADLPLDATNADAHLHKTLITAVERDKKPIIKTELLSGTTHIGLPILFDAHCLSCHAEEVASGHMQVGGLAGTLIVHAPISINRISSTTMLAFFVLFLTLFISVATWVTNRLIQNHLLNPLSQLNKRIDQLRLSTHQQAIDWQRTPQTMLEIDQIDAAISEHIHTLQGIYNKLDALVVTEHETGLFHKSRFNEVLKYELFRSHRFGRPFSLVAISLIEHQAINPAARTLEQTEPGAYLQAFGSLLQAHIRQTDLAFRLDNQLFTIIAPETNQHGMRHWHENFEAFILKPSTQVTKHPTDNALTDSQPLYQFSLKIGTATHDEIQLDAQHEIKGAKDLMLCALDAVKHAKLLTLRTTNKRV